MGAEQTPNASTNPLRLEDTSQLLMAARAAEFISGAEADVTQRLRWLADTAVTSAVHGKPVEAVELSGEEAHEARMALSLMYEGLPYAMNLTEGYLTTRRGNYEESIAAAEILGKGSPSKPTDEEMIVNKEPVEYHLGRPVAVPRQRAEHSRYQRKHSRETSDSKDHSFTGSILGLMKVTLTVSR